MLFAFILNKILSAALWHIHKKRGPKETIINVVKKAMHENRLFEVAYESV